nr:zinc finger, CCHC-type [Tanacetum cinerariifolium]
MGTMWCLCDPTPSGWCKMDALSTDFAWTRFKDLLQNFPHPGIDLWLQVQIFYDHVKLPQDEPLTIRPEITTLMVNEIGTPRSIEPEQNLEDEFKDLHLDLPVIEVLAHAPMYNVVLDKYVESLELGKNGSALIQGEMPKTMKDLKLFTLPYILGKSEPLTP